jgi:hypothetical protein
LKFIFFALTLRCKVLFMKNGSALNDLAEIRSIMERSTKFLSLSAASAVLAGVYALVGAALAWRVIYTSPYILYPPYSWSSVEGELGRLIFLAAAVFLLAAGTTYWLSYRKARKAGERMWTRAGVRLLVNFVIPLFAGGVFITLLYVRGFYSLMAASSLLFYGMALLNAGNFTFSDIRKLGVAELALGLLAAAFPGKGLLFWALGFGVLHIVYGGVMYWKYEKL